MGVLEHLSRLIPNLQSKTESLRPSLKVSNKQSAIWTVVQEIVFKKMLSSIGDITKTFQYDAWKSRESKVTQATKDWRLR